MVPEKKIAISKASRLLRNLSVAGAFGIAGLCLIALALMST